MAAVRGGSRRPCPFRPRVGAPVAAQRCRILRSGNRNLNPDCWSRQRIYTLLLTQADNDLPLGVTASCFSVCLQSQNVKGVSGNITVTNVSSQSSATMNATVKVQCSGVDVLGATQTVGGLVTSGAVGVFPYSI